MMAFVLFCVFFYCFCSIVLFVFFILLCGLPFHFGDYLLQNKNSAFLHKYIHKTLKTHGK